MSLTKILSQKDANAEEQLVQVAEIIAKARQAYGNEDAVIDAPMVNTPHGNMSFVHLEADSKVAMLRGEVAVIKAKAVEFAEQNAGANINKCIEELLAIDPYFTNVGNGTKFEYI